ncbi:VRR-NUC domain-containing protein [Cellvibrio polysaccharolyticus]|uniref:phosphodiesterase I n=1 Tax=Cellvibrio polysaccharolyticus TaxID=2082724 RepID=A0A928V848_9GAMM|nr:VRR-NUC domain-containing protein [Cellvibrio polysaccharolyticus]MBE8717814.1 VRR-NUC domain-containing protein [Cellvibrio polysaccharolyticus]
MTHATTPPDLAPDYYLTNFRFLVDWVAARYNDLLDKDDLAFIQTFQQLDHPAQCLLVRLCSRKGPLFRQDKLRYPEVDSISNAVQTLLDAGLMQQHLPISLTELAASLTRHELLTLFEKPLTGLKQARKDVLIQTLAASHSEPQTWQNWTRNQLGEAWHLDHQAIVSRLLILFFGNPYQNLTDFVLQDLGLFRYENYQIDHRYRLFKSRDELEQYQQLVALRDALDGEHTIETLQQLGEQLPPVSDNERLQRRRARLCNDIAYKLERNGNHEAALQLYGQSHLPPARERRIRLLEKQQNYTAAWALLNELLATPANEQELQIARRMAPKIAKKLGHPLLPKTVGFIIEQQLSLTPLHNEAGEILRVEEVVRLILNTETAPCVYAENALLTGMFGLWLWPEMFRGIEGAFANPFQAAPLDMYQENFVSRRPGIDELRSLLKNGDYREHTLRCWQEKFGITNHFVNWSFLTRERIELALHCIPASHLTLIFERILFDIKNNRSGLPDLIQFFPEQASYRMIEVKGPGDRIQDNQQRWLDYFAQHSIPAEVAYVRWQ